MYRNLGLTADRQRNRIVHYGKIGLAARPGLSMCVAHPRYNYIPNTESKVLGLVLVLNVPPPPQKKNRPTFIACDNNISSAHCTEYSHHYRIL